ncbi:hypothetical protein ABFX02_11G125300 [Erythranthe guttata]
MDGNGSGSESLDWNTDDEVDIRSEIETSSHPTLPTLSGAIIGNGEASTSNCASRTMLIAHFVGMGFSDKLVSKAIDENGEGDTESILNTLLTYSSLENSPEDEEQCNVNSDPSSSDFNETFVDDYNDNFLDDDSDADSWGENEVEVKIKTEPDSAPATLSEKDNKLLALASMGYTREEASTAMERCGQEASILVLTDFICAAQVAREQDCYLPEETKRIYNGSNPMKKRKLIEMCKKKVGAEDTIRLPNPMIGFGVPSQPLDDFRRSLPEAAKGPPYFYYENVALAPKGVWDTISRFLYEIEPEFVDSKYFSATARKRGYVHNLPIKNRFPLIPLPPLTIHQAFPLTRKWWPAWDPRDKLNCIQTAIGSAKLTERIRSALERYDNDPPESVQKFVIEQCRKWNLVWVGRNKVAPLEPDEVEMLLGFPKNHTRGGGISRTDRYKSLGNSFQVDTVAYHLSVLKDIFPNGINMLSLFSGIGGAEVALHRLGIKLKNVVSIEKSKVNRDIVRSWWEQTNQTGNLIDFDDVQQFDVDRVVQIINNIGGFDLVVGGSPCNNLAGSNRVSRDGLEGKESALFYDYFRILDLVKCVMRSRE